jgi:hypothetical protein
VVAAAILAGGSAGPSTAAAGGAKCGAGLTAYLTPQLKGFYDFTLVCIQHDRCYAHFGISRSSCDTAFIGNMLAECKHQYPTENNALRKKNGAKRRSCESVAGRYHLAVVRDGETDYELAQEDAAGALFNGSYTGVGTVTGTFTQDDGTVLPPQTESLANPVVVVEDDSVGDDGSLDVAVDFAAGTATADAIVVTEMPGFSDALITKYRFTYSLNGPAKVTAVVSGGGRGAGVSVRWSGSISGTRTGRAA